MLAEAAVDQSLLQRRAQAGRGRGPDQGRYCLLQKPHRQRWVLKRGLSQKTGYSLQQVVSFATQNTHHNSCIVVCVSCTGCSGSSGGGSIGVFSSSVHIFEQSMVSKAEWALLGLGLAQNILFGHSSKKLNFPGVSCRHRSICSELYWAC